MVDQERSVKKGDLVEIVWPRDNCNGLICRVARAQTSDIEPTVTLQVPFGGITYLRSFPRGVIRPLSPLELLAMQAESRDDPSPL